MDEKSDRELVALARADDKQAFCVLIERYQMMAFCLALRLVGNNGPQQNDLVQEVCLQVSLSPGRLRDDGSFKSWFYGIVAQYLPKLATYP